MGTYACTKAKMGNNAYFHTTMKVRELLAIARPAKEQDGWLSAGLEDRKQLELNEKRVKEEIAPYLANSADRFFGSIIVLLNPETTEVDFEPITSLSGDLPLVYKKKAGGMGFLTLEGGELVILDGQHRFAALREVVQGSASEGEFSADVGNDDISVIFIEYGNEEKTRSIVSKLNRQVKGVGRTDNLLQSEDDGYAIVTRKLLDVNAPLGARRVKGKGKEKSVDVVNWRSNTIATRSLQFIALKTVYDATKEVLLANCFNLDQKVEPTGAELDDAFVVAQSFWDTIINKVNVFKTAIDNPSQLSELREPERQFSLLLKPAGQVALVKALMKIEKNNNSAGLLVALEKINDMDFSIKNPIWNNVLVQADKIVSGKDNVECAAAMIAYYLDPQAFQAQKSKIETCINVVKRLESEGDKFSLDNHSLNQK